MTDSRNPSRQERLKAALRDNLKRRKAQARGRAETTVDEPGLDERADCPEPSPEPDREHGE